MEVTSRADLWGCSFNRYGDQSTLLLIDFLVSLHILSGHTIPTINVFPWVQDWEVAFFHHISQNMQTRFAVYYLCPCAHKGIVLVLCSWPPQHHLFSRLTVIPMSNTRWFLTSVRPDLKTDALQTWPLRFFGRFSVTFGDFRKMCNVTKNPAEVSVSPLDGSVRTEWPLPKNTSCKNDCIIN